MLSEKRVHWWVKFPVFSNTFPSLTTYLSICPLSNTCWSLSSRPNIVSVLVYKCTMIHYNMPHEPVGLVHSFSGNQRGFVQLGWPWQFYTTQHTFKCSSYCLVMDCQFSLEDAVSVLDLSVLVLAGNFRLKCHSRNSLFHHPLVKDCAEKTKFK